MTRRFESSTWFLPGDAAASHRLALRRGRIAAGRRGRRLALQRLALEGTMRLNVCCESASQASASNAAAESRCARAGRGEASLVFVAEAGGRQAWFSRLARALLPAASRRAGAHSVRNVRLTDSFPESLRSEWEHCFKIEN